MLREQSSSWSWKKVSFTSLLPSLEQGLTMLCRFSSVAVYIGTVGGGEPAASADDPPDTDTFSESVDFDINYQQNGRITGTAKNDQDQGAADEAEEQPDDQGPASLAAGKRKRRPKTGKSTKGARCMCL